MDKYAIIEAIKPDIILLGYDQKAFTEKLQQELGQRGVKAEIRRAEPFEQDRFNLPYSVPRFRTLGSNVTMKTLYRCNTLLCST